MRSPARLDGHGPVRARDERLEQLTRPHIGPYFTETEVDFWMERTARALQNQHDV